MEFFLIMQTFVELIANAFASSKRRTTKYDSYYSSYAQILEPLLIRKSKRGVPVKLLEIGVMDGGSLEAWKKILGPESLIYGLDLNPECAQLSCNDYTVFVGDQADPSTWKELVGQCGEFDIIIDDGSHIGFSQAKTIDYALLGGIGKEGIVIIEDIHTAYMDKFHGDGVGVNFMNKISDIIARINSRSARLREEPSSRLSYVREDDLARTSIESLMIFESIVGINIRRGLTDSSRSGSGGSEVNSIRNDVRGKSVFHL